MGGGDLWPSAWKTHMYYQHQILTLLLLPPPPPLSQSPPTYGSFFRQNRRNSPQCRYTRTPPQHRSRLCTSNKSGRTRGRLNNRQIAFIITCIHLHRQCIRLSSFSYTCGFTAFVFLVTFIHLRHHCQPPFSSFTITNRVSLIHRYCQLHSTLSSHPLTSIVTHLVDIIAFIDHHLFRSILFYRLHSSY